MPGLGGLDEPPCTVTFKKDLHVAVQSDVAGAPECADSFGMEPPEPSGNVSNLQQLDQFISLDNVEGLFGNLNESDFPEDWTPVSLATGDDIATLCQSMPLSNAPDAGSSVSHSDPSTVGVSMRGPVLIAAAHDARFSLSLLTNCSVSNIELPWETEFYRDLFDDDSNSSVVPKMPVEDLCAFDIEAGPQDVASAVPSVARHSDSNSVHSMFVSCSDDFDFYAQRQRLREAANGKLLIVLRHCLLASETGRHIIALGNEAQQTAGAHDIVDAVVGIKSAATLVKRANALLSFLRWFAREGHTDVNPFGEKFAWKYFEIPLTVCHIKRLRGILVDENVHITDRAVVAYLLFALYGRCRNSDLLHIHALHQDFDDKGGFLIIETSNHKSGRLASLKTRLMPIVIPARGVDGSIWTADALGVFDAAGAVLTNPIDGPPVESPC
eukprot:s702_g28.t1